MASVLLEFIDEASPPPSSSPRMATQAPTGSAFFWTLLQYKAAQPHLSISISALPLAVSCLGNGAMAFSPLCSHHLMFDKLIHPVFFKKLQYAVLVLVMEQGARQPLPIFTELADLKPSVGSASLLSPYLLGSQCPLGSWVT